MADDGMWLLAVNAWHLLVWQLKRKSLDITGELLWLVIKWKPDKVLQRK